MVASRRSLARPAHIWAAALALAALACCCSQAQAQADGDIRLFGGSNSSTGRLEMYSTTRASWGTVCDDNMDDASATVVCRQLGYPAGAGASWETVDSEDQYGAPPTEPVSDGIFFDGFSCTGDEMRLTECATTFPTDENCGHSEDVAVTCQGAAGPASSPAVPASSPIGASSPVAPVPSPSTGPSPAPGGSDGALRLFGGNATNGRLEMYSTAQQRWGTVCDDDFGQQAANVACRQLGFPNVIARWATVPSASSYGPPPADSPTSGIFFDSFSCNGTETRLTQCATTFPTTNNCGHSEDVALFCNLAAPSPPAPAPPLPPGVGDGSLRLFGGNATSGRLEMYSVARGRWGTVCDDSFGVAAANVSCRELGFTGPSTYRTVPNETAYGPPPADAPNSGTFFDGFSCAGTESRLIQCSTTFPTSEDCEHNEDVALFCSAGGPVPSPSPRSSPSPSAPGTNGAIRLYGGNATSGRLEMYSSARGRWGTVCDDSFNAAAAAVVCRQLGFSTRRPTYMTVPNATAYGPPPADIPDSGIFFDEFSCNGNETMLTQCATSFPTANNCGHSEDIAVTCRLPAPPSNIADGALRLFGGNATSGRLEMWSTEIGMWGTVCDDNFDDAAATVACNQLGFVGATAYYMTVPNATAYGEPPSDPGDTDGIFFDSFLCVGNETELKDCAPMGAAFPTDPDVANCQHSEDIALTCDGGAAPSPVAPMPVPPTPPPYCENVPGYTYAVFEDHPGSDIVCLDTLNATVAAEACSMNADCVAFNVDLNTNHSCLKSASYVFAETYGVCLYTKIWIPNGYLRLTGGDEYSGRLEVYSRGLDSWGGVCNETFDNNAAMVACQELGFAGYNYSWTSVGGFAPESYNDTYLDMLTCQGTEQRLTKCAAMFPTISNCTHSQNVMLQCVPLPVCPDVPGYNSMPGQDSYDSTMSCMDATNMGSETGANYTETDMGLNVTAAAEACSGNATCMAFSVNLVSNVTCSYGGVSTAATMHPAMDMCFYQRIVPENGELMLEGGSGNMDGLLEVYDAASAAWGTVCNNTFDSNAAMVACSQLGYAAYGAAWMITPSTTTVNTTDYGVAVNYPVILADVRCSGMENKLYECAPQFPTPNNCTSEQQVEVSCMALPECPMIPGYVVTPGMASASAANLTCVMNDNATLAAISCVSVSECAAFTVDAGENMTCWYNSTEMISGPGCFYELITAPPAGLRLVGGTDSYGRLEVYDSDTGMWGTVCDDNFDNNAASVACWQLGYSGYNAAYRTVTPADQFGKSPSDAETDGIFLDGFYCSGLETRLRQCTTVFPTYHDCDHSEDIVLSCQPRPVNCEEVAGYEVIAGGDHPGDDIACAPTANATLGAGNCTADVTCMAFIVDAENSMTCGKNVSGVSPAITDGGLCYYRKLVNGDVKLVGGSDSTYGQLEVYSSEMGMWGTVCNSTFDNAAAQVACTQYLGSSSFATGWSTASSPMAIYGPLTMDPMATAIYLEGFQCQGNETMLTQCASVFPSNATTCTDNVVLACQPL